MLSAKLSEEYPWQLQKEYQFLQDKYRLEPIQSSLWKFLRLRPNNFPTIRISQFARFLYQTRHGMFSLVDQCGDPGTIEKMSIAASAFWDTHYVFGKISRTAPKMMGRSCIQLLNINGLATFVFFYGKQKDEYHWCEKALDLLEKLPPDQNGEIARWNQAGIGAGNALHSQALLQLKQFYCDRKQCLECRIGTKLLEDHSPVKSF